MSEQDIEASHLIGMTIEYAKNLYGRSGWIIRCVNRDSKELIVTQNLVPNRINVETVDGVITKVRGCG